MQQRLRPDLERDDRAVRPRYANASAEDVVSSTFDTLQDAVVDAAHDLGGHETAGVDTRQLRRRATIEVAGTVAFETQQGRNRVGDDTASQIGLVHTEPTQIFHRQVDATATEIDADVSNDVRQLERHAETLRVGLRALIAVAE